MGEGFVGGYGLWSHGEDRSKQTHAKPMQWCGL